MLDLLKYFTRPTEAVGHGQLCTSDKQCSMSDPNSYCETNIQGLQRCSCHFEGGIFETNGYYYTPSTTGGDCGPLERHDLLVDYVIKNETETNDMETTTTVPESETTTVDETTTSSPDFSPVEGETRY